MIDTTTQLFEQHVVRDSHTVPVLVDFWAPWCGPCRVLGPVLERVEAKWKGRFRLVKVNTEQEPALAQAYRISSIPAVKLFVDGQVRAEFAGALPEPTVERFLNEHLPSDSDKLVDKAEGLIRAGDNEAARALLEQSLEVDPAHERSLVALAGVLLPEQPDAAAKLVQGIAEGSALHDRAHALATVASLLQLASETAPPDVDADSKGWPRYREGLLALRQGSYAEAAQAWIDVVKSDRRLLDDGARKACVALFTWLGEEHAVTREYRRPFSSALF